MVPPLNNSLRETREGTIVDALWRGRHVTRFIKSEPANIVNTSSKKNPFDNAYRL